MNAISPTDLSPATPVRRATRRDWAALAVLTLAVVLLAIDGTVLSLAVPALTADLDPSATQLLWIGDIYSFALAGLLVTMGNVADRVGRKRLLMIGSVGFAAASVLAAFAPTAETLILARALLGLTAATLMPSTLSIIRNVFEDARQRTTAIAVWSAGAMGGAAVGPLVGGYLLEHFWWGSVFLINVPVMVVLVAAGAFLIPESRNPRPGPFDPLSAVLSMLAIVPVVYAVKQLAGHGPGWDVAVAALVGVASGVAFVRRQRHLATPLVDVGLFRNAAFSGAVVTNLVASFALSGLLFFFSQYLQLVRGYGPLEAGIREMPVTIASIVVIGFVGVTAARLGRGRAIGAGMGAAGIGLVALAFAEGSPDYLWIALSLVLVGLGLGIGSTLTTDAVMASVPSERAGAASSISETAYELGVALGIALLGSLQTVFYRANLDLTGTLPAEVEAQVTDSLASASRALGSSTSPGAGETLVHAQEAFTHAMQLTSGVAALLLLGAAAIAWRVIPSPRAPRTVEH